MGCLGSLMLLPFFGLTWVAIKIADACAKKGGGMRFLGVLAAIIIGGFCGLLGYWIGIDGWTEWQNGKTYRVTYPVWGWIGIILGGLTIILASWRAITETKESIELEEQLEELKKSMKDKNQ